MEFRLFYEGPLRASGTVKDKHTLRLAFHPQLAALVNRRPMTHMKRLVTEGPAVRSIDGCKFAPLIAESLGYVASLHITLLTSEEPGSVITQGGDLDNRLKTLFDALRIPKNADETIRDGVPDGTAQPIICLLEDDALVSGLSVVTDKLLRPEKPSTVLLLVHVVPRPTMSPMGTVPWV